MRGKHHPFIYLAGKIVDRFHPERKNKKLAEEIRTLQGGRADAARGYYVRKTARLFCCVTVLCAVCIPLAVLTGSSSEEITGGRVERPGYGESSRSQTLVVQAEGETEERKIEVSIGGRQYSEKEADEILKQAEEEFSELMLGENASEDEVRDNLIFPDSLQDGKVSASYMTRPYGILSDTGAIIGKPEETGTIVEIEAAFTCQEYKLIYECSVNVFPPLLSKEESFWKSVDEEAKKAESADKTSAYVTLPEEADGKNITWYRESTPLSSFFILLMVLVPVLLYEREDSKVREQAQKRKEELVLGYPQLLWKLSMLLGAGLTLRAAFCRVASQTGGASGLKGSAYEEVVHTCHEMDSGVSESEAYQNFGRRCGLPQYIKLGSMLAQALKKGTRGLTAELEKEASAAMEERRSVARQMGEKAGTKMLLPMILMLLVVLMILIVPAFMSL